MLSNRIQRNNKVNTKQIQPQQKIGFYFNAFLKSSNVTFVRWSFLPRSIFKLYTKSSTLIKLHLPSVVLNILNKGLDLGKDTDVSLA